MKGKTLDLTDKRFGRLVAIERVRTNKHAHILWRCECDCGNINYITSQNRLSMGAKSCGCHVGINSVKNGRRIYIFRKKDTSLDIMRILQKQQRLKKVRKSAYTVLSSTGMKKTSCLYLIARVN